MLTRWFSCSRTREITLISQFPTRPHFKSVKASQSLPPNTYLPKRLKMWANNRCSLDNWYISPQFKDLLKLKNTPNGGVAVTDDLKYTSTSIKFGQWITSDQNDQSNFPGRMVSMSLPPFSGMAWSPTRSPAPGVRKNGTDSWKQKCMLDLRTMVKRRQKKCNAVTVPVYENEWPYHPYLVVAKLISVLKESKCWWNPPFLDCLVMLGGGRFAIQILHHQDPSYG